MDMRGSAGALPHNPVQGTCPKNSLDDLQIILKKGMDLFLKDYTELSMAVLSINLNKVSCNSDNIVLSSFPKVFWGS